jgi:hypothetical protein
MVLSADWFLQIAMDAGAASVSPVAVVFDRREA